MSCGRRRRQQQRCDRLDELDVTKEELDGIGEALKTEQFRKLLCEYVDDVTDPENVARYEREMEQYERERGVHVTFVRPRPGYVVKTSADGERKVFVNVCSSDAVAKPTRSAVAGGHRWSLPHCASPVRRDYDRARKPCDVYDVVFHPDALEMTAADPRIRDMVEDTALTAVEKADGVALDRANLKYPKVAFKGLVKSLVLRRRVDGGHRRADEDRELPPGYPQPPPPPPVDRPVQHHDLGPPRQKSPFAVPKYAIKYRSDIDIQEHGYGMHCKMNAVIPKELIVEIKLPLLDSAANVQLDVLPKSLKLVCDRPSKYRLDVGLPYAVLEDDGTATFDQSAKTLTVRLPVSRTEPPLSRQRVGGRRLVSEVDEKRDSDTNRGSGSVARGVVDEGDRNGNRLDDDSCGKAVDDEAPVANGHSPHDANVQHKRENDVASKTSSCSSNGTSELIENGDDVHYSLPEHELIFHDETCVLTLNVKNVDPTTINVMVENRENSVSGKLQSVGSGFFPVWFAFCLRITSETSLSDVRVLPSDERVVVEFSGKPERNRYWFGLNRDALTVRYFSAEETLKENSKTLANYGAVVSAERNDDSDDDDDDDDVFVDDGQGKEIESKRRQRGGDAKKNIKEKNVKTPKEKKKKKNKFQKSNSVPLAMDGGRGLSNDDFVSAAGSLPIEFHNAKPTIRGILKKRSLSECSSTDDAVWSSGLYGGSSVDNVVDTESPGAQELSFNDGKKSVRFNAHVVEKKINFNISIAAQAKKHRQRQQRKRNIREYNTPSESEASEAEDRTSFGPLNVVSESEETSVSESSAGEMSDDNGGESTAKSSKVTTVVADSKKDHKRRKSKSARKNASLAKQASTNNLIFPIDY